MIALDALRAIAKDPESMEELMDEIYRAHDPRIEAFAAGISLDLNEAGARRAAERLALALQASLVARFSPPAVADAFCASRLDGDSGKAFGALPPRYVDGVVEAERG